MSVHVISYKDGAKIMTPVLTRSEYLRLRGSRKQQSIILYKPPLREENKSGQKENERLVATSLESIKGINEVAMSRSFSIDFPIIVPILLLLLFFEVIFGYFISDPEC